MYTDRNALKEYNFEGTFYLVDSIAPEDGNLLVDDGEKEIVILKTKCDIQETNKLFNAGVITMGYTIFFPNPTDDAGIERMPSRLKPGVRFKSEMYGMSIDGMVIGIYPTQMHGCVAYIKGTDI